MNLLENRLLHYSAEPLGPVVSADQKDLSFMKPRGLWVSVEGPEDWREWCESENFALKSLQHVHEVKLSDAHEILFLESVSDIIQFTDQYFVPEDRPTFSGMRWLIDWAAVAKKHKGIIIAPYQFECRLRLKTGWYYGWDCASGCIWDPSAIAEVIPQTEQTI